MNSQSRIIIITGVSIKESQKEFTLSPKESSFEFKGIRYKLNAAAGTLVEICTQTKNTIIAIGYNQTHLSILREHFAIQFESLVCSLKDESSISQIQELLRKKENNSRIDLIHYGDASDTTVSLPNNTVFLSPWETPSAAFEPIIANAVVTLNTMLHALEPFWKKTVLSKLIIVTALTSYRTKRNHMLDATQKGAIHAMARSLALDLTPEKIYVTEVMPGITDSGFYDNPYTLQTLLNSSKDLGYTYSEDTIPFISARSIGKEVVHILNANYHIREVSLIPFGQYPHMGA